MIRRLPTPSRHLLSPPSRLRPIRHRRRRIRPRRSPHPEAGLAMVTNRANRVMATSRGRGRGTGTTTECNRSHTARLPIRRSSSPHHGVHHVEARRCCRRPSARRRLRRTLQNPGNRHVGASARSHAQHRVVLHDTGRFENRACAHADGPAAAPEQRDPDGRCRGFTGGTGAGGVRRRACPGYRAGCAGTGGRRCLRARSHGS